uniref:non-specific serine/threonine protein kinase n=1 Tax=Kalanchoe fedtschenkoi TaxID=63787 RepID=A0A7N0ZXK9_KALFE
MGDDAGNKAVDSPVGVLKDFLRTRSFKSVSTEADEIEQSTKSSRSNWKKFGRLFGIRSFKTAATLHPMSSIASSDTDSSAGENETTSVGDRDCSSFKSHWINFSYWELKLATNNFSSANLVGKGGYAEVYKGRLKGGKLVAIKRLTKGTMEEKTADFLSEIGIMAHVNHPNTAKLIGYGVQGGMHLVLDFSSRGSLASWLQGAKGRLEWRNRYKVAVGIAEGLLYLHKGCKRRIIHRDIKAANILLTEDFEPQICDFGLAKWLPEKWTHHTVSKFEGTFGYLAPEYLMHGIVDEKTDVFSYGVLLLELITGRRALDISQQSLVLWAKPLIFGSRIGEMVDPWLTYDYDPRQMNLMVLAASLCIKQSSIRRPQMNQIVQLLRGNIGCFEDKRLRRIPFFRKAFSNEPQLEVGRDYECIKDSDLIRHKQLVFEFETVEAA